MTAGVELGRLLETLCIATNPSHAPREMPVSIVAQSRPDFDDVVFAYRYLRGLRASPDRARVASVAVQPLPDAVTLAAPLTALCEIAPGWLACGDRDGVIRIVTRGARGCWDCVAVAGLRSHPIAQLVAIGEREFVSLDASGIVETWRPAPYGRWAPTRVAAPPDGTIVRIAWCPGVFVLLCQSGADCVVVALDRIAGAWAPLRSERFPGAIRAADAIGGTRVAIGCEDSLRVVDVAPPIRVVDTLGMQGAPTVIVGLRRQPHRSFAAFGQMGGMTVFEQHEIEAPDASGAAGLDASRWVIKAYLSLPSAAAHSAVALPSGGIAAFGGDNTIALLARQESETAEPEWQQVAMLNARPSYGPMILGALCDGRIAFTDGADIAVGQPSASGGWVTRSADRIPSYNGYALIEPLDDKTLAAWRPGEAIALIGTIAPPVVRSLGAPETAIFAMTRLSDNELIVSTPVALQLHVRADDGSWTTQSLPQWTKPVFSARVVPLGNDAFVFFSTLSGPFVQHYTRSGSIWSEKSISVALPGHLERAIVFADTLIFLGGGGLQVMERRPGGELAAPAPAIPFNAIAPANLDANAMTPPPIASFVLNDAAPHARGFVVLMDDGTVAHIEISEKGSAQVVAWIRIEADASHNRILVRHDGWIAVLGESRAIKWLKIEATGVNMTIRDMGSSMPLLAVPRTAMLIGQSFTVSTDAGLVQLEPPSTPDGDRWMSWVIDAETICETEHHRKDGVLARRLFPRDPAKPWRIDVVGSEPAGYASSSDYRLHPYLGVVTRDGRVLESWQTSDNRLEWVGRDGNGAASLTINGGAVLP